MALQQSIELALATNIGEAGLPQTALDAALVGVGNAAKRLARDDAAGGLPLLRMPRTTDDLDGIREAAARLKDGATDVVFLGTGGSSLGGQTLAQLSDYAVPGLGRFAEAPRVHFLDNLDPQTFGRLLEVLPLATSRFVAISKSGGTGETLMQAIAVLSALDKAGLRARAPARRNPKAGPASARRGSIRRCRGRPRRWRRPEAAPRQRGSRPSPGSRPAGQGAAGARWRRPRRGALPPCRRRPAPRRAPSAATRPRRCSPPARGRSIVAAPCSLRRILRRRTIGEARNGG